MVAWWYDGIRKHSNHHDRGIDQVKTIKINWREIRRHTAYVNVPDDWQPDDETATHLATHEPSDADADRDGITWEPARFRPRADELGQGW
jgi:hypothetical protein